MELRDVMAYLRAQGPDIGHLIKQGDALAKRVFSAYEAVHRDQLNVPKQNELIHVVEEYIRRDTTQLERDDLKSKFGYKL